MYKKYFVYVDDGVRVFRIAIIAVSEDEARALCAGNGEIIAVRDVTELYPISLNKVLEALRNAGFGAAEMNFIARALTEFDIAEGTV